MNYQALKRSEHIQLLQQKDLKIHYLQFELEQLKRAIFGSKSERFVPEVSPDQLLLFEELQKQITTLQEESTSSDRTKKQAKRKPKRTKLPAELRRETTIIEPDVDTAKMTKLGKEVQEKLAIKPMELYVKQTVRPKYKDNQGNFHIAQLPSDPFPKSIASPSLAAHIAVNKYVDPSTLISPK